MNSETTQVAEPGLTIDASNNAPVLLRGMGILAVIAGFCAYLLEGWDLWSGVSRFYVMEAVAVVLAVAGFATSYWLQENKGARSFFALALVAALAFTTTLGGFIYSALGSGSVTTGSSFFLIQDWSVNGLLSLLIMAATAIAVALPLSWFAFKVFNRPHARMLTITFLSAAALVLLPVRESFSVGLIIIIATALPVYALWNVVRQNPQFKTLEGRFSAAVLFAPAVLMLGRLFWLYQADAIVFLLLCSGLFAVCRILAVNAEAASLRARLLNIVSVFLALAIACISVSLTVDMLLDELVVPVAGMLFWGLLQVIDRQCGRESFGHAMLADFCLAIAVMLNSGLMDSLVASLVALATAGLFALRAWRSRETYQILLMLITLVVAVLPYAMDLMTVIDFTNWITLGILGVAAIVIASVLERFKRRQAG